MNLYESFVQNDVVSNSLYIISWICLCLCSYCIMTIKNHHFQCHVSRVISQTNDFGRFLNKLDAAVILVKWCKKVNSTCTAVIYFQLIVEIEDLCFPFYTIVNNLMMPVLFIRLLCLLLKQVYIWMDRLYWLSKGCVMCCVNVRQWTKIMYYRCITLLFVNFYFIN